MRHARREDIGRDRHNPYGSRVIRTGPRFTTPSQFFSTLYSHLHVPLQATPLRMSPNAAPAQHDKQSLNYIIRSGLAGGVAGCVVCLPTYLSLFGSSYVYDRQRQLSPHSIGSRFSSKHQTQIFRSTLVCEGLFGSFPASELAVDVHLRDLCGYIPRRTRYLQAVRPSGALSRSLRHSHPHLPVCSNQVHDI